MSLAKSLPTPKHEYILSIRLSERQIELYRNYLQQVVGQLDRDSLRARKSLFAD